MVERKMIDEEKQFFCSGFDAISYFKEIYNNKPLIANTNYILVMHPNMLKLYEKQLNKFGRGELPQIKSFRGMPIITTYDFDYTQIEILRW